jgi:hypothetical protein
VTYKRLWSTALNTVQTSADGGHFSPKESELQLFQLNQGNIDKNHRQLAQGHMAGLWQSYYLDLQFRLVFSYIKCS